MSASRRSRALEEVKEAGAHAARSRSRGAFDYHGFVEGDDIGKGTVDVVVTEGFAGNIALKTRRRHGAADRRISARCDEPHLDGRRIGYVFARGAFDALREKMDVRKANGGVFLGLNGIVVKSHGGTDAMGICRGHRTRLRHGRATAARQIRDRSRRR